MKAKALLVTAVLLCSCRADGSPGRESSNQDALPMGDRGMGGAGRADGAIMTFDGPAVDANRDSRLGDANGAASEVATPPPGDTAPPPIQLEWRRAADGHMHANSCGNYISSRQDLIGSMKQNHINVGSVLIWGDGSIETEWKNFLGQKDDPISEANYVLHWDLEISALPGAYAGGHVVMLNLADKNVVKDGKPGYPGQTYTLPNFKYAHDQGAIAGYAHGGAWAAGSFGVQSRFEAPHELPLDVVLDHVDFLADEFNFLSAGFLWIWHQMLDAGFNLPIVGGSDIGCLGNDVRAVGARHSLFGLPPGAPLTYRNYTDAILAGRTIIEQTTNDPETVDLRVNEVIIGGEVILPGGISTVDVEIRASGSAGKTVDLVVNGVVQKTGKLTPAPQTFHWPITVTKSSWIAARTANAHTSAIFALVAGCPVRNDAVAARRWKTYLDAWYQVNLNNRFFGVKANEVAAKVDEAKAAWERIAQEAEGTVKPACKAAALTAVP